MVGVFQRPFNDVSDEQVADRTAIGQKPGASTLPLALSGAASSLTLSAICLAVRASKPVKTRIAETTIYDNREPDVIACEKSSLTSLLYLW
jgi:hypothetical protein